MSNPNESAHQQTDWDGFCNFTDVHKMPARHHTPQKRLRLYNTLAILSY